MGIKRDEENKGERVRMLYLVSNTSREREKGSV